MATNSTFDVSALAMLACPGCHRNLYAQEDRLVCASCHRIYPIVDGIPVLIVPKAELRAERR